MAPRVLLLSKRDRYHDVFTCPHKDEEWHCHALRLVLALEETPSGQIAGLMRSELQALLKAHGHS